MAFEEDFKYSETGVQGDKHHLTQGTNCSPSPPFHTYDDTAYGFVPNIVVKSSPIDGKVSWDGPSQDQHGGIALIVPSARDSLVTLNTLNGPNETWVHDRLSSYVLRANNMHSFLATAVHVQTSAP